MEASTAGGHAILNVGGMNTKTSQESDGTTTLCRLRLDLVAGIKATHPAAFSCFDALVVDYTGCRAGLRASLCRVSMTRWLRWSATDRCRANHRNSADPSNRVASPSA